jgi:choline kinase
MLKDVIILAAGRGTRMKSLTAEAPKCLIPLLGRTLLDWQLESARQAGFQAIHIIGGFAADKLPPDMVRFINTRWAETNMVATLFEADRLLSERGALVAYSDIVYRPEHLQALNDNGHQCAILYDQDWESLWRLRNDDYLADAESFQTCNGRVTAIGEKGVPADQIQGQYMGLLKFTAPAWREIKAVYRALPPERQDKIDMTGFLRLLLDKIEISAVPIRGGWVEVDTESDRDLYEAAIQEASGQGRIWSHDWRPQS